MKITEITDMIGPVILLAMIASSLFIFYKVIKASLTKSEKINSENQNKTIYRRMIIFGMIGFSVFFSATWLRLQQLGADRWGWNPYSGPPPLMTCLFIGTFGLTIGALVGLITKKKAKQSQ
jgi:hypothetical protein